MAAKAGGTPEISLPPAGEALAKIVSCNQAVLLLCPLAALVVSYSARCKNKTACATVYAHIHAASNLGCLSQLFRWKRHDSVILQASHGTIPRQG